MAALDGLDIGNDIRAQFTLSSITGIRGAGEHGPASREKCDEDEHDKLRACRSTLPDITECIVDELGSDGTLTPPGSEDERQVDDLFAKLEERRVLLGLRDESMSPMSSGDEAAVQQLFDSLVTVSACSCFVNATRTLTEMQGEQLPEALATANSSSVAPADCHTQEGREPKSSSAGAAAKRRLRRKKIQFVACHARLHIFTDSRAGTVSVKLQGVQPKPMYGDQFSVSRPKIAKPRAMRVLVSGTTASSHKCSCDSVKFGWVLRRATTGTAQAGKRNRCPTSTSHSGTCRTKMTSKRGSSCPRTTSC